jgi:hypothetical protein
MKRPLCKTGSQSRRSRTDTTTNAQTHHPRSSKTPDPWPSKYSVDRPSSGRPWTTPCSMILSPWRTPTTTTAHNLTGISPRTPCLQRIHICQPHRDSASASATAGSQPSSISSFSCLICIRGVLVWFIDLWIYRCISLLHHDSSCPPPERLTSPSGPLDAKSCES